MAERKSKPTDQSVSDFLDSLPDEQQRNESYVLLEMMREVSGAEPVLYGTSIVGFGSSPITYADGHTEDWPAVAFSPRKGKFSLYIVDDAENHREILARLGRHKTGKACIWVRRLSDIDLSVLRQMIRDSVRRSS